MKMQSSNYNGTIIKPPDQDITNTKKWKKIIIDSRYRDYEKYPSASNYTLDIELNYKDVVAAQLVLAQIPNSGYNINDSNNTVLLHDSSNTEIRVKLQNGDYTNESLVDYLNGSKGNLFNNINGNGQYFNFYYDSDTKKIEIQSNKSFTFNNEPNRHNNKMSNCYKSIDDYYKLINFNSIDKTLGFNREIHTSSKVGKNCNDPCDTLCETCDPSTNITSGTIVSLSGLIDTLLTGKSDNGYDLYDLNDVSFDSSGCDLLNLYNVGDYINIGSNVYRIYKIYNSKFFTLEDITNSGATPPASTAFSDSYKITSNNVYNIECPDYIILKISNCTALDCTSLDSNKREVSRSFSVIPLKDKCKTILDSSLDKQIKNFSTIIRDFKELKVQFLRHDGSEYDFNGKEHMFILKIFLLKQPLKYNNFRLQ